MKTVAVWLVVIFLSVSFAEAQSIKANENLHDVKKIFVSQIGKTDSAEVVREKIKLRLIQSGKFNVVENRVDADAVLTGTVVMDKFVNVSSFSAEGKGVAVFYLRDAQSDKVIWTYEYKPKFFSWNIFDDDATRSYNQLADRTVEKLLKDAGYKTK